MENSHTLTHSPISDLRIDQLVDLLQVLKGSSLVFIFFFKNKLHVVYK